MCRNIKTGEKCEHDYKLEVFGELEILICRNCNDILDNTEDRVEAVETMLERV